MIYFDEKLQTMYDAKFLEKMKLFGLLKYELKRILLLLDAGIDEQQFIADFENESSNVKTEYNKGRATADFAIDSKLFSAASGDADIDAIEEIEKLRTDEMYNRKLKEIFDV